MSRELPLLREAGAYDRLRTLQRHRRIAARVCFSLFVMNVVALAAYALLSDIGRFLS